MLSIITSLYRSEKFLPTFIKEAEKIHKELRKAGLPFEHILIANDMSLEEESVLSQKKGLFTLVQVPRETIYATWNRGAKMSTGDYITFWNVDDGRFSEALIDGTKTLASGYDATYFPFIYKRYIEILGIPILIKKVTITPQEYDAIVFRITFPVGPIFMVKRHVFDINGYFDETFRIAGDFDWWSRLAHTDISVKKTNTLGGIFTNNGKTLSGSKSALQQEENKRIISKATV